MLRPGPPRTITVLTEISRLVGAHFVGQIWGNWAGNREICFLPSYFLKAYDFQACHKIRMLVWGLGGSQEPTELRRGFILLRFHTY